MTAHAANLGFRFRSRAYAMALLSMLGFALAEQNIGVFIVAGTLGLLSWFIVEAPNAKPLPRVVLNLGVLGASLLLLSEVVILEQTNLLLALGHFMIALLVCKLYETKNSRDWAQILTLSLFVISTGAIISSSFVFGAILAAYLAIGIYTALLFYIRLESDRAAAQQASVHVPVLAPARRDIGRTARRTGVMLGLFGAAVFAVFPRGHGRQWLQFLSLGQNNAVTGFSDRVTFNSFGQIQLSDAVVMHVTLTRDGKNIGSEFEQPYFRGATLDVYDGQNHAWIRSLRSTSEKQTFPVVESQTTELAPEGSYRPAHLTVQHYNLMVPTSGGILYAMNPPVRITSTDFTSVVLNDRDLELRTNQRRTRLEYAVTTPLLYDRRMMPPPVPMPPGKLGYVEGRNQPFSVPEPLVKKAREIVADLLPPDGGPLTGEAARAAAHRIQSYLQDNFTYSTRIEQIDKHLDPTTDFVVNRHSGHCEYFASAMLMLARGVGIQGRMVTGYHGGEYNPVGGFYVVRARDAHAWDELYIPGYGWERYDATPYTSAPDDTTPITSAVRWLRQVSEVVQRYWNNAVVAFDNSSRGTLSTWLFGPLRAGWRFMSLLGAGIVSFLHSAYLDPTVPFWTRLYRAALSLIPLVGLGYLVSIWFERRKDRILARLRRLFPHSTRRYRPPDLRFIDRMMRLLRRTGVARRPSDTPREYVDLVRQSVGDCPDQADWLVDTYYGLRFGNASADRQLRGRIRQALAQLRQRLTGAD